MEIKIEIVANSNDNGDLVAISKVLAEIAGVQNVTVSAPVKIGKTVETVKEKPLKAVKETVTETIVEKPIVVETSPVNNQVTIESVRKKGMELVNAKPESKTKIGDWLLSRGIAAVPKIPADKLQEYDAFLNTL